MTRSNEQQSHEAGNVRQGEIILRNRWQQIIFGAGLAGLVLLALSAVFIAVG